MTRPSFSSEHWVVPKWCCSLAAFVLSMLVPWMAWISYHVVELKTNYEHSAALQARLQLKVYEHDITLTELRRDK